MLKAVTFAGMKWWLKYFVVFGLLLPMVGGPAMAQFRRDTTASSLTGFRATQIIAPAVLVGSGLAIHFAAHESWDASIRNYVLENTAGCNIAPFDDYIQYVPMTLHLGLGLTGIKSRHGIWDRMIESALAHAVCGVIMLPSKTLFHTLRPNEANYMSFPSGHTAFSFTGAELTRMDYGWAWGAGAYAVSSTVAFMRIYRNWHWLSDVLAGAGVGILAAQAGGWLLEPVKRLLGIRTGGSTDLALVPVCDPFSRTAGLSFGMTF